jgi:hypothetical protein
MSTATSSLVEPASSVASPRRRRFQLALAVTFLAALALPTLDLVVGLDPNPSPLRETVPFPPLHLDRTLLKFPGNLLWYLKSSMGFRGALVRAHGLFAWKVLGVSPAPESAFRGDPWLFLRSERVDDDFRRVDPMSAAELERWRAVLEARRDWLAKRGIKYLVVVAPNKETIYAEDVPPWFTRAPGPSRLAQLREMIERTRAVDFLDLTEAVAERKASERVYHLTDTHWNDAGAFAGYRAIAARLAGWFPAVAPLGPGDVERAPVLTRGGDLARVCGLQTDLLEPQVQIHLPPRLAPATFGDGAPLAFERTDVHGRPDFETRSPSGEIPTALVLRDSFGEGLIPYLSRHFQRARWIWTYEFPARVIEEQRPAVVVDEIVERKLMVLEPANPPEMLSSGR